MMVSMDNNMGAVRKSQVETFWAVVRDTLGLHQDFQWSITEPSICLGNRILIRETLIGKYPWEAYQEVLHEVAHIQYKGHGRDFHAAFAKLVDQFLGSGVNI